LRVSRSAAHIEPAGAPEGRATPCVLPAPQLILGLAPRRCEPSGAGRRRARRPVSNPYSGSKPWLMPGSTRLWRGWLASRNTSAWGPLTVRHSFLC